MTFLTDWRRVWRLASLTLAAASSLPRASSAQVKAPFDSPQWRIVDGEVVQHLGRPSLRGTALLEDVTFTDGTIEVDVAVDGRRSYPGIMFRVQSEAAYESFYIRPHRAGLYPDALQYTPVFNGVAGWQLYHGEGFTAGADIPSDTWVRVRLEVRGGQARVFLGDRPDPALVIPRLEHGASAGALGVSGPSDGTAYFSNFRYSDDAGAPFAAPPAVTPPPGTLLNWSVSGTYPADRVRRTAYPNFYAIFLADWRSVTADSTGLVDVARYVRREHETGDLVLARTVVRADTAQAATLSFGYSDDVDLFLNGRRLFSGESGYQSRDPSFLGLVGLHDAVHVELEPGLNEIFLMLTERFGGWGFMMRADPPLRAPLREAGAVAEAWATDSVFLTPETVVYDPQREVLYLSNFDNRYTERAAPSGYLSRLALDGRILTQRWVTDLAAPTGMAIWRDTLYVAERTTLTAIDLGSGAVVARWPIPDVEFPNDVAVDSTGTVYVSDTRTTNWPDSRIYRFRDGRFDVFANAGISRANGLCVDGDYLIVGSSGDGHLKRVRLSDGRVEPIVSLGAGIIDGIQPDGMGNLLVSHWEGLLYRISPAGTVVRLLDAWPDRNLADFAYLPDRGLLVVPTFLANRVAAYRVTLPPRR